MVSYLEYSDLDNESRTPSENCRPAIYGDSGEEMELVFRNLGSRELTRINVLKRLPSVISSAVLSDKLLGLGPEGLISKKINAILKESGKRANRRSGAISKLATVDNEKFANFSSEHLEQNRSFVQTVRRRM